MTKKIGTHKADLASHACRSPQTRVENSEKIRTGPPQLGHPIQEVSIPILLQVKIIVIDVGRSLKGDRQGPTRTGVCVYLFFVMREILNSTDMINPRLDK